MAAGWVLVNGWLWQHWYLGRIVPGVNLSGHDMLKHTGVVYSQTGFVNVWANNRLVDTGIGGVNTAGSWDDSFEKHGWNHWY